MKRIILAAGLAVALASQAFADFETGLIKFEQGDFAGALAALSPLAGEGDARAQYIVGIIVLNGMANDPQPEEGAGWLRRAAEQGYVEAQVELARLYKVGEGVEQNPAEMVKWYHRAAEQGHVGAQLFVADAYAYGQGVEVDLVKAYVWYEVAIRYWGDLAVHAQDIIAKHMSEAQIAEAKRQAEKIQPSDQ